MFCLLVPFSSNLVPFHYDSHSDVSCRISHAIDSKVSSITDWLCFLILDIGNPITEAVPVGTRVLIGLLQVGFNDFIFFLLNGLNHIGIRRKSCWIFDHLPIGVGSCRQVSILSYW